MKMKCIWLGIVLILFFNCQSPTPSGPRISVFNECKPQNLRRVSEKDFIKDWFYIPVTYGEKGFNPVFIPFTYKSEDVRPDTNQSLTFPALLSFKFDFVPDNYTSRHPAYVYAWDINARYVKVTDPAKEIAAHIEAWRATHAVGGEVIHTRHGYSGSMVIFDKNGKEILKKRYVTPMPYFTLMGEMVRDWLEFAGWGISDALSVELFRPMTADMATVEMYGKVFSLEHRSQEEWDVYEKILKRDPGFAEIRFWYANQKAWQIDSDSLRRAGYAEALRSHLVLPALAQYPIDEQDTTGYQTFKAMVAYAGAIFPGGHPVVATRTMDLFDYDYSIQEIDSYLSLAQKFPCSYDLLCELAYRYRKYQHYEKNIPLCLSAIYSGYLTGIGHYGWPLSELADSYTQLGYLAEGQEFCYRTLSYCEQDTRYWTYASLAANLREQFRFKEAAELFRETYMSLKKDWILCAGYMSLFEAGDTSQVRKWLIDQLTQPSNDDVKLIIEARQAIAAGDLHYAKQLMEQMPFERVNREVDSRIQIEAEIVKADINLLSGDTSEAYYLALNSYFINPRSRRTIHLIELTFARTDQLVKLYTIAAFLFPEQSYWQDKLKKINEKGFRGDSDDEIMHMYEDVTEAYEKYIPAKRSFWFNADPYFMENLCLRMVKKSTKDHRDKGLSLYLTFHNDLKGVFNIHTAHTRTFFMLLLNQIPPEERSVWLEKL